MAQLSFRDDQRLMGSTKAKLRRFCENLGEDLIGLASDLGVKVFTEELWPYESGYLEYAPSCGSSSNYRIVINEAHSLERQRFTVAHELAHFLLHRDQDDWSFRSETRHRSDDFFEYLEPEDAGLEREANLFAASLLMPQNLLKPSFHRLGKDVDAISKLFQVSQSAMTRRLRELGLN